MSQTNKKGFTIIEVVLVLAIAGLIFLVVFLALPALQKSQRDTQRKADLSRLMSQITAYSSNNQGSVPTDWATAGTFYTAYLTNGGEKFSDPQGAAYTLSPVAANTTAPSATIATISVYTNAKCDSSQASGIGNGSGARSIAAAIALEKGGYLCQNN
jgi:prepilin-type N-terminal cleavage/methylation domain-containing protein